MTKVGINGFAVSAAMFSVQHSANPDFDVVAVNDLTDSCNPCTPVKIWNSIHATFDHVVNCRRPNI